MAFSVGAAAVGAWLIHQTTFDANVLRLLPRRSAAVRDFRSFLTNFGSLDHLYIVFDADDGIGEHSDFVDAYVDGLRRAPEIDAVDAQLFEPGRDWNYLADRELYLLGANDAAAALQRFRPPRLDAEVAHARELLSMPSPQVKALVQQDPLGLLSALRDRMRHQKGFGSFDISQDGYVSRDGRSRLLIVNPKGAPFDTDFCKALFARLAAIEAKSRAAIGADVAGVKVQAAGAYRVSLEAEAVIRREAIINSVGSLVVLLSVMVGVFRTPWILVGGFAPLAVASILTLGINGRIGGTLSPATSGFAGMLFGLGIDGVVLLYLRYVEERVENASVDDAVRRMGSTASSVVLAQATTAATFLALLIVDLPTLQDLGSLVGVGILLSCAFTLLLLPGLLPRSTRPPLAIHGIARALGGLVTSHSTSIVWVSVAVTVLLGIGARRLTLDTSIDRLQAQTAGARLEDDIAVRFSLPRDVLLVMQEGPSLQRLLETDERLRSTLTAEMPGIAVNAIGLFLASNREQDRVAAAIRASDISAADAEHRLSEATSRAGFRPNAFAPFSERLPRLLDPSERITYQGLTAHGLGALVSRFVARQDDRFQMVTYLYTDQPVDLRGLTDTVRRVDPALRLTGLPVINDELRRGFLSAFAKALGIGTLAVVLLAYGVFRTIRDTVLMLVPTIVGLVWSAGLLALGGVELDLFSMFATVTFIGIAVDYGVYVLYRYRFESLKDVNAVVRKTGVAIIVAGVAALIGFGSSMNSSYRPLHLFGIVSIVTLACCILASLVVLPAILHETERWSRSSR